MASQVHAAVLYKERANVQRRDGRKFIDEISPKPGDTILDIGCGTGELTAYLAELVGPTGKVIGVDPDCARIKLAQESYQHIENLTFVEGCGDKFPDMDLGKYDLVFSSTVLHWIFNKEQVFSAVYHSLKPGGKVAFFYSPANPLLIMKVTQELFPEIFEQILKLWCYEDKEVVKQYCLNAGFTITKNQEFTVRESFDSMLDFCKWFEGVTHGLANVASISKERLDKFVPPDVEGGQVVFLATMVQIVGAKK